MKDWIKNWLGVNFIKSNVPKSTVFPHKTGIIIAAESKIGENCRIYQNVTIGRKDLNGIKVPTIGNNIVLFSGAQIIGGITIGDNVVVGAGAIVINSVPDRCVVGWLSVSCPRLT